jgi:hypothetical protein
MLKRAVCAAWLVTACGSPALLQCRVDAVAALPLEPDQVSVGDVRAVVAKLKACQAQDGGAP